MSSHESEELYGVPKKGGLKPFGDNDYLNTIFQMTYGVKRDSDDVSKKFRKNSVDSDLSDDLDEDQAKGSAFPKFSGYGGAGLLPLIGSKPALHDSAHEAPHLIQQSNGTKRKAPMVEDLLGEAAAAKKPLLLDELPAEQDPTRDGEIAREPVAGGKMREFERGKILKDVERAPMSKKAPAKLKRGFGDNLISLGKGLGSFGLWALSGFGLGGAIGAGWSKWRGKANAKKAANLEAQIKQRNRNGDSNTAEGLAATRKLHTKMGKHLRAADLHEEKKRSRLQFASGYQWRKRLGWHTESERDDIYDLASSEGNTMWRSPYDSSEENMAKPLATWRDARDVHQGRNADPIPQGDENAEPEQEMQQPVQQEVQQPVQQDDGANDIEDDEDQGAWLEYMKRQAELADMRKAAEEEKLRAMVSEGGKGPKTAAAARMMSKRVSQARATQRLSARQTSSLSMRANLGSTKANAPEKQPQPLPQPIIEEESEEES